LQLGVGLPILLPLVPNLNKFVVVVVVGSIVAITVLAAGHAQAQVPPVGASAEVRVATGRLVATAEFREGRGEVLITLIFPTPSTLTGTHAVHIMEVGRCDPPDFLTAANIFNPGSKKHGRQNPEGPMAGDLPNVNFTNGLTSYNTSAPGATLGPGPGSLLGPNRASVVIYSGEDDQLTDPDGNAGSRIACGVVTPAAGLAAQPVAKPVASPGVVQGVVPKPAVAAAASPTPVTVAQPVLPAVPTVAVAASQTSQSSAGLGPLPALLIAIFGVALIGAGYLMRRRAQLRRG
jgi:superoxide dismutase, Cu-Zn family